MLPTEFNLTFKFDPLSSLYFAAGVALAGIIIVAAVGFILR